MPFANSRSSGGSGGLPSSPVSVPVSISFDREFWSGKRTRQQQQPPRPLQVKCLQAQHQGALLTPPGSPDVLRSPRCKRVKIKRQVRWKYIMINEGTMNWLQTIFIRP